MKHASPLNSYYKYFDPNKVLNDDVSQFDQTVLKLLWISQKIKGLPVDI